MGGYVSSTPSNLLKKYIGKLANYLGDRQISEPHNFGIIFASTRS